MELKEQIAKIIAGSRCEVCNNCGAAISTDNPDDVAKAILALIAKQGKPPVLTDQEIETAWLSAQGLASLLDRAKAVAKAQRDAWSAWGLTQKQEVIEWLEEAMGRHPGGNFYVLYKCTWQAYKKSLGITSP